jgi:hypothetical protein
MMASEREKRVFYDLHDLLLTNKRPNAKPLYVDEPITNNFLEQLQSIVSRGVNPENFCENMRKIMQVSARESDTESSESNIHNWEPVDYSHLETVKRSMSPKQSSVNRMGMALRKATDPDYQVYLDPFNPSENEVFGLSTTVQQTNVKATLLSGMPYKIWHLLLHDLSLKASNIFSHLDPNLMALLRPDSRQSSLYFKIAACALRGTYEQLFVREHDLVVARHIEGTCNYISKTTQSTPDVQICMPQSKREAYNQPHLGLPIPSNLNGFIRDDMIFEAHPAQMWRYII